MAATDLYDQTEALLDACTTILGTTAPPTAFVSPGEPIYDCCPMLAVHVASVAEAATSPGGALDSGHRYRHGRVNLVSFVVSIVRCDPEVAAMTLPDVAAKQAVASEVLNDLWTLWNGLYRLVADEVLFAGCGERYLDGATPVDSSGGCVGTRIGLRASIPGFNPFAS